MKKTILIILHTLFLIPVALQAETPASGLPSIACLYQTSSQDNDAHKHEDFDQSGNQVSTWKLWRTVKQVEIHNTSSFQGEIWTRLKGNTVEYSWLDHKNKFRVNYPDSDLKATRSDQLWKNKSTLISPELLLQLKQIQTLTAQGYSAEKYKGVVGDYQLEIIWIPELSIPAKIIQHEGSTITTTELQEVYAYDDSPWEPLLSDEYEDMDFSDIGDNEANPIARSHLYGVGIARDSHKH